MANSYLITGKDMSLGLQEVEAFKISIQSVHEGDKVDSTTHWPPLPSQEISLILISLRG
jgi:hypothetical protein